MDAEVSTSQAKGQVMMCTCCTVLTFHSLFGVAFVAIGFGLWSSTFRVRLFWIESCNIWVFGVCPCCSFEVYWVSDTKGWGLRTLQRITSGTELFPFAGLQRGMVLQRGGGGVRTCDWGTMRCVCDAVRSAS